MLRRFGTIALLLVLAAGVQGVRVVHQATAHGGAECSGWSTCGHRHRGVHATPPNCGALTADAPSDPQVPAAPGSPDDGPHRSCDTCAWLALAIAGAAGESFTTVALLAPRIVVEISPQHRRITAAPSALRARPPPMG